jgi:hypothetical protein
MRFIVPFVLFTMLLNDMAPKKKLLNRPKFSNMQFHIWVLISSIGVQKFN